MVSPGRGGGGEAFELPDIHSLTFIVGPLGSGKTRLARTIADAVPDAAFLGLERLANNGEAARTKIAADPALNSRVDEALDWLVGDGATVSAPLVALLATLESDDAPTLVVDMIEQGLDQLSQEALIAYLRTGRSGGRTLSVLTRSTAILDLTAMGTDEAIILCPANHSPPAMVLPYPGTPGYEAIATCLASPEVRARTAGVIAIRSTA